MILVARARRARQSGSVTDETVPDAQPGRAPQPRTDEPAPGSSPRRAPQPETDEPAPGLPATPAIGVLLTVRFLLELALLAAYAVSVARLVGGAVGWAAGAAAALVVATVWGLLLAPRRRYDASLPVRIAVELVLFAGAASGLWLSGLPGWGVALLGTEVVTLALLRRPGEPVGGGPHPHP